MFTNDFKEKANDQYIITLPKEGWRIYIGLLKFLYNPSDDFLDTCTLQEILIFLGYADQIQSQHACRAALNKLCSVELEKSICDSLLNLSPTVTCLEFYVKLKQKVQQYLSKTFQNVEEDWISEDFLNLGINSVQLLLQSEDIVTRSENSIWT
eukprot:UN23975